MRRLIAWENIQRFPMNGNNYVKEFKMIEVLPRGGVKVSPAIPVSTKCVYLTCLVDVIDNVFI